MSKVQVGLVQMSCVADKQANLDKAIAGIRDAAAKGAQIVCLQELFTSLYFCDVEDYDNFHLAEPIPGPSSEALGKIAAELGVVIIASLFEKRTQGIYHNTTAVLDADGSYLSKYRKMHIPDDPSYYEKFYFTPGDLGYRVFKTKFATIGVLICWDQWYPELTRGEQVNINVNNETMRQFATDCLVKAGVDMSKVQFFIHPTNDAWCRDHGPAFLINPAAKDKKIIVDWDYNAWGGKYPPFDLDDVVPTLIAKHYNIPVYNPGIIMEGGSVEFNGKGTLITSTACLLNENRNPHLSQEQVAEYLMNYYGVDQVLWVLEGIVGDDTDGHIDDTVRFVNEDTVLTVIEENKDDENYELLQANLADLEKMRLLNGKQLNIVELPMPDLVKYEDQRLPASYANFYIANASVIVPTFRSKKDEKALRIIQECFPGRDVVGIDSTDIIWGLGSFHCLSQQEPAV